MAKIQDVDIPYLEFAEAAAPGTPAAGIVRAYAKADGLMYQKDDAGTETQMGPGSGGIPATIFDAQGDIIVASAADTAARLAKGATGTVLTAGASTVAYAVPPGYELAYAQITAPASITATTEGGADTVVATGSVTYDGAPVLVEVFSPNVNVPNAASSFLLCIIFEDSTYRGIIGAVRQPGTTSANLFIPFKGELRLTPSAAAHTFTWKAYVSSGTGDVVAGPGTTGDYTAAFIRVTKV